jgi:divalent metal cation (Fe/Co/Zn/Cd) transporter
VDGNLSVRKGHRIGHEVKAHLLESIPKMLDVAVHLEPYERKRDGV